jgi:acyl-CoA synthetase (NDP forming)
MNQQEYGKKDEGRVVAVIGASSDRSKYGNRAVRAYRSEGWRVYPVHPREAEIEGLKVFSSVGAIPEAVDRATVYLSPPRTLQILDDLAAKGVPEVFLNPGSESSDVIARGQELGLNLILACSIVDIGRSPSRPD